MLDAGKQINNKSATIKTKNTPSTSNTMSPARATGRCKPVQSAHETASQVQLKKPDRNDATRGRTNWGSRGHRWDRGMSICSLTPFSLFPLTLSPLSATYPAIRRYFPRRVPVAQLVPLQKGSCDSELGSPCWKIGFSWLEEGWEGPFIGWSALRSCEAEE